MHSTFSLDSSELNWNFQHRYPHCLTYLFMLLQSWTHFNLSEFISNYHLLISTLGKVWTPLSPPLSQSAWAVEYTDCTSAEGVCPPPTSVLYMTLNNLMVRFQQCWGLGNTEYPFIAIAPRSTLARRGSTWQGPIYGLNRNNGILMLNWISWNRNVFDNWTVLTFWTACLC